MTRHLYISVRQQRLFLLKNGRCEAEYSISTGKNGLGELADSYCTPRGWHAIADIIGLDQPINTVFKARVPTGKIYTTQLALNLPNQDWILSRIIRLRGRELNFNLGGQRDTYERFIYIHGCADDAPLGRPESHGCIRMNNHDIMQLATCIHFGDSVFIG